MKANYGNGEFLSSSDHATVYEAGIDVLAGQHDDISGIYA